MKRRITIVAEAAQGFEGSVDLARKLVRAAREGDADAVKFQLVYADEISTPQYKYYDLFKKLEMSDGEWKAVSEEARKGDVALVFDVYGHRSLSLALSLGASAVKIHATDFFHRSLFDEALAKAPEVLFSVGGIYLSEIEAFLKDRSDDELQKLTMLYGFQAEPTKLADNNLLRLVELRRVFPNIKIGFMDHADGDSDEAQWLGCLAVPCGICLIEKHITVDRALKLEDYISALGPREFKNYVRRIRASEDALGSAGLALTAEEEAYRRRAIKTIVAAKSLSQGATVKSSDIMLLRTVVSNDAALLFSPSDVVGKKLVRGISAGSAICRNDIS